MRSPAYQPEGPHQPPPGGETHVVIFDGNCGMCQEWVERLKRWDRDGILTFRPYQDPAVPGLFPWIPQDAFKDAVQVVAPDGRTWEGAGAAERLAHLLPWGGPLAFLFRLPLVRSVADRAYRWVAENRGDSCTVHGSG